MIKRFCTPALLLVAVLLSGCFFDHPLTGPSKDINTWLLGVWEHTDDKGKLERVRVTPLTGSKYAVVYLLPGNNKRETKEWRFEGWISHVGDSRYLTLKCVESAGQVPVGAYVFTHYQVVNQYTVILRTLQLEAATDASSFDLRKEVRKKQKDNSLLVETGIVWTRVSEVYWNKEDPYAPQPFQPLRYQPPTGSDDGSDKPEKEKEAIKIKGL